MAPVSLIRPNGMQAGYHISQNGGKYCFFIRNYGKYCFRFSDREGYFSQNMSQKAASICSESGKLHLLFAAANSDERSRLTISTLGRFSNHAETVWTERSAKTSMGLLVSRSQINVP